KVGIAPLLFCYTNIMESTSDIPPQNINSEKEAQIDRLLLRNQKAFEIWVSKPEHKQRMDLPLGALQVLIPRRIFEIADDPNNVSAIFRREPNEGMLQSLIVERKSTPVSNSESLSKWIEAIK